MKFFLSAPLADRLGIVMYTENDHAFVICAYKENPFLEETIQSLLGQTLKSSIIVSTSTPNSHITSLCDKYMLPMVVNPCPHLPGNDWNYGYDAAETPLVTIAHQDDIYDENYLEEILEAFNRSPENETSIVFSDYYELRDGERVRKNILLSIKRRMNSVFRLNKLNGSRVVKRRVLSFGCSICCPSVTLCKPVAGPSVFDTFFRNSCDYQTWVNLASKPGRFVYVPKQLMGHRIYSESATTINLRDNIRKKEDGLIMSSLWPAPVARIINAVYATSENSNRLK